MRFTSQVARLRSAPSLAHGATTPTSTCYDPRPNPALQWCGRDGERVQHLKALTCGGILGDIPVNPVESTNVGPRGAI